MICGGKTRSLDLHSDTPFSHSLTVTTLAPRFSPLVLEGQYNDFPAPNSPGSTNQFSNKPFQSCGGPPKCPRQGAFQTTVEKDYTLAYRLSLGGVIQTVLSK